MNLRLSMTAAATAALLCSAATARALEASTLLWTQKHGASATLPAAPAGYLPEVVSFDSASKTLWVAGVRGVDVLDALTGTRLDFIDTSGWGSVNSVAIHAGIAAFAIEADDRKQPGRVVLFDTQTRALAAGTSVITVGSLPDMLTFTPDGRKLLVANEGTPNWIEGGVNDYGLVRTTAPNLTRSYGYASEAERIAQDPVGSVSIIDMASRSVVATPTFGSAPRSGSHIRNNTGMDFEPEYIAVDASGTRAWVSLQEANAVGLLDLDAHTVTAVVGLGAKDYSQPGNEIDPRDNGTVAFASHAARGLYMPDGLATYRSGGQTFVVMANEGDFREDDEDRSAATSFGATGELVRLRVSNTDSSNDPALYAAGARSFSIRDADGRLVYDSGSILDREAHALGIYDDGRSRDKGVEPEGVALMAIDGKTFAFIGLERTTQGAIAVFDVTDPNGVSFVRMLLTGSTVLRPEGLTGYAMDGTYYLAVASEGSNFGTSGTAVFSLAPVPEPGTWAMMGAGLLALGALARRRR